MSQEKVNEKIWNKQKTINIFAKNHISNLKINFAYEKDFYSIDFDVQPWGQGSTDWL